MNAITMDIITLASMDADNMTFERDLYGGHLKELGGYVLYVDQRRIDMWPQREHAMRSAEALMAYRGQDMSIHTIPCDVFPITATKSLH